jgi:hypothetical protein
LDAGEKKSIAALQRVTVLYKRPAAKQETGA